MFVINLFLCIFYWSCSLENPHTDLLIHSHKSTSEKLLNLLKANVKPLYLLINTVAESPGIAINSLFKTLKHFKTNAFYLLKKLEKREVYRKKTS